MALTNLLIQLPFEEIPPGMRGQFFELHAEPKYDKDGIQLNPDTYVGWVHFREDGRIEFGEPGV
jgi:hypothetical protein